MIQSPESTEDSLRAEIAELRRRLDEREAKSAHAEPVRPGRRTITILAVAALALAAVGFASGYLPRHRREAVLAAEAGAEARALPAVNVAPVRRSPAVSNLVLPGSIQPVTEAPVLARADGYVKRRYVDIGDRVAAGQVLAEIEAPELQQQVRQAQAALDQAQSTLEQSMAALQQGKANLELARVTAARWDNLAKRGVVSRQENDTYQAQYQSQTANVAALDKAVAAARSNVGAAQANLARLHDVESYQKVRAPFAGVVTMRNVDTGALIAAGNTLLFRVAQTGVLRTYVNLPQAAAGSVKPGQNALITLADLPGKVFHGSVTRTANALDPASRTLLVEVQVPNPAGTLLPGMYAQVDLSSSRPDPPLVVPGDALVIRSNGTQVAVVNQDGSVHFQPIEAGRDYGDRMEILSGLREGEMVVLNPGDAVREGAKVNPVRSAEKAAAGK